MELERLEKDFGCSFDRVKDKCFIVYRLCSSFDEGATFSGVSFNVKPHLRARDTRTQLFLPLHRLFDYDASKFEESHLNHLRFIKNCKQCRWPPDPKVRSESELMVHICSEIMVPLCRKNEVFLEKRYRCLLHNTVGVQVASMGIGSNDTWHGTPDARVRGAPVILMKSDDDDDISDISSELSDGMETPIEGKLKINLPQAIATCVISAFTERTLHPHLKSCVPTILIDETAFRVIMYDCEIDSLLISEAINLKTRDHLSKSAMTVLWLVLNHRSFLRPLPKACAKYPSGIQDTLKFADALQHYTKLEFKNLTWPPDDDDDDDDAKNDLPLKELEEDDTRPPAKKRRQT